MKTPIVLLFSCDPLVERAVQEAVLSTRHGLREVRNSPDAFEVLQNQCADVDVAIIDLDPGMHGAALLEAASERLPVIALTSLEENYMTPLVKRHGALACVSKPFEPETLAAVIERVQRHVAAAI